MGQTYQSIVINAPTDEVWTAIRNLHDMSWAPNVIGKVEAVGNRRGDQTGAERTLNGAFRETLFEFKEDSRSFAYSIDDGPSPVSKSEKNNYVGRVAVGPVTEGRGTFVEWSSVWNEMTRQPRSSVTGSTSPSWRT